MRAAGLVKILLGGVFAVVVVGVGLFLWSDEPRPSVEPSKDGQTLARAAQKSVNQKAWEETGLVAWNFGGRRSHLWDRVRGYVQVKLRDNVHLIRLSDKSGLVFDAEGKPIEGLAAQEALHAAWEAFINDAFWLNPIATLFNDGTKLGLKSEGGEDTLLVEFSNGGATPGDVYQLYFDEQGRLRSWKMWVGIIPVGGLQATFEGWIQLSTGAWVSTQHKGLIDLELSEVSGSASLVSAGTPDDPFAPLENDKSDPDRAPATQPARTSTVGQ